MHAPEPVGRWAHSSGAILVQVAIVVAVVGGGDVLVERRAGRQSASGPPVRHDNSHRPSLADAPVSSRRWTSRRRRLWRRRLSACLPHPASVSRPIKWPRRASETNRIRNRRLPAARSPAHPPELRVTSARPTLEQVDVIRPARPGSPARAPSRRRRAHCTRTGQQIFYAGP
jgi:hypothetical protein